MNAPLVWVISADADTRWLIALNLNKRGHRVREVLSQSELASIDEVPHLIILDMDLPTESWWEAAMALRQRDGHQEVPLILISSTFPTTGQLHDLQPVYWIEKPLAVDTLLAVTRACMNKEEP